ncbi:MAG: GNAT family N-acetyltransferase [Bdellovibrionota bacterium]
MDIRNPTQVELHELISRISTAFSYTKEEGTVARDFPLFYNIHNLPNLWAAYEDGKLVGHAGHFPAVLRVENLPLSVVGIGGVYTEADYQSQGIGTKLLEKNIQEAQRQGAALAILWSDRHEFYGKLGFYLTGRQWTIVLDPKFAPALHDRGEKEHLDRSSLEFFEGGDDSNFLRQSHEMISHLPLGVSRTLEEHTTYLSSGSCKVISAWAGNELAAYFVIGKGKDLTNCIHEWAGEEAALHHLAAHCLETYNTTLYLFSPQFMPDEVNWIYSLNELGIPMKPEFMALVKLLDFGKMKRLVAEYLAKASIPESYLRLEQKEPDLYIVQWKQETELHFTEAQFLRFLFGPELPTSQEMKAFFPLRIWYWGMDSV